MSERRKRCFDPLGSTGGGDQYKDVCLIHALQALGVDLTVDRSGPFRADEHGNSMLRPLGLKLVKTSHSGLRRGKWVKWQAGHFSAVLIAERVTVMEKNRTFTCTAPSELGRPGAIIWWRLTTLDDPSDPNHVRYPEGPKLPVEVLSRIDHNWAECMRRRAASGVSTPTGLSRLSPYQLELISRNREQALRRRTSSLVRPLPPVGWKHPLVPQPPTEWATWDRSLPDVTFLSCLNAHPRDRALRFYPDTHTYLIHGQPSLGSVTGLIHSFCQVFVADDVIARMVVGRNWPRPGYIQADLPVGLEQTLADFPECYELIRLYQASPRDEDAICCCVKQLLTCFPHLTETLSRVALSPDQIKHMWDLNRDIAANMGTWMHFTFEAYLNRMPIPEDGVEMGLFLRFLGGLEGLTAYRTEWTIWGDEERLAGSIDFVAITPQSTLVIFDWKRSKSLRDKYTNRYQSMAGELSHIPDCQGMHYRLQLNAYRYLLQKYYDHTVSGMFVVCTHPDNSPEPWVDDVPIMEQEIEYVMACQRIGGGEGM